ncbi:MAG: hypothetical protein RBT45_01050 [Acholeplasmataceae bacterium]|jgi:hypothetical protein|nr:hypothetical protein [Acholeplasmataceae bacterium]
MSKTTYTLTKGTYFFGDPAILIKKTVEGDQFITRLWDLFYIDHNQFQHLTIDSISFYMTRTKGGDGRFNGVGTDTGTFIIIDISQIENDPRFIINKNVDFVKYITVEHEEKVTVDNFDIYFESGLTVITE